MNQIAKSEEYSHVLTSVELIIHSFIAANPDTNDHDILNALKEIRKNSLHEFSHSEEDALAFAIIYGMSRGLQQKRLTVKNPIAAELRGFFKFKLEYESQQSCGV